KTGLRLSEIAIGTQPQARHFPRRNRIISGMARAVVVVEAAARSGSLITAKNALDQGREVLAVPGHPFDARAYGCNALLRDGATLVRSAEDVTEAIGKEAQSTQPKPVPQQLPKPERSLRDTSKLHREILARLGPSPVAEDQLIRDLELPSQKVTPELLNLELDGRIIRAPGGLLSLAK
ncbi:MAG TPA: DNA-processing protein DprA, partial [Rhodobacteraceae bacterium]|nr:DNA-processing protein DprA [Paracoccaceae bacterium]